MSGRNTVGTDYRDSSTDGACYIGNVYGHTGTTYLEGNAKQLIKDGGLSGQGAISASGGVNFALSGINVSINTATNTSYVLAKFKVN